MNTIPISDEMAEMIGYLKWIGVLKPFDIATSHYDELNEMRENGGETRLHWFYLGEQKKKTQ